MMYKYKRKIALITLLLTGLFIYSCGNKKLKKKYPVLGRDALKDVFVCEDHSEVFTIWAQKSLHDVTVIHVDAYDALSTISEDKIKKIKKWINSIKQGTNNHLRNGISSNNFLYAAARSGMVREVYWVIPYRLFDDIPLAKQRVSRFLKTYGGRFKKEDIDAMVMEKGCLGGVLNGVNIHICSYHTLPIFERPVVVDIDVDFFPAMAFEYQISKLRALKWFFDELFYRKLKVQMVDVAYSVNNGYTKPIHRYIGDEIIQILKNPAILNAKTPPELWTFRDTAENMLSGGEDRRVVEYLEGPIKKYPEDIPLRLLDAMARLYMKHYDEAYNSMDSVCNKERRYCYGFLYMADILSQNNLYKEAERFYRKAIKEIKNSKLALKQYAEFLYKRGRYHDAEKYVKKLPELVYDVDGQFMLASCYYREGKNKEALVAFDKAMKIFEKGHRVNKQYLEDMKDLYKKLGEKERLEKLNSILSGTWKKP